MTLNEPSTRRRRGFGSRAPRSPSVSTSDHHGCEHSCGGKLARFGRRSKRSRCDEGSQYSGRRKAGNKTRPSQLGEQRAIIDSWIVLLAIGGGLPGPILGSDQDVCPLHDIIGRG
jgi:hypothetical protein